MTINCIFYIKLYSLNAADGNQFFRFLVEMLRRGLCVKSLTRRVLGHTKCFSDILISTAAGMQASLVSIGRRHRGLSRQPTER